MPFSRFVIQTNAACTSVVSQSLANFCQHNGKEKLLHFSYCAVLLSGENMKINFLECTQQ